MRTNLERMEASEFDLDSQKLLVEGEIAGDLIASPAWRMLLDWAEKRCEISLTAIRGNKSSDPLLSRELQRNWQRDEGWLTALQSHFIGMVNDREYLRSTLQAIEAGLQNDQTSLGEDTIPVPTSESKGVA